MNLFLRPLAAAALGAGTLVGTSHLLADAPPPAPPPGPPAAPAEPAVSPVKVTDAKVAMRTAVTPKPLSPAVKGGLAYLVKNQQEDGGWSQGGGWRTNTAGGGRVEGKNVEDPSDVGNTCFALLALIRAGSTPTDGEHKDAVAKGLRYLLGRVEKADKDSLYVTDVRGTQLQSKIGPYVDTFLTNLVLAELKGKGGAEEPRLVAALEKTMNKVVKHQTADGGFAGNGGWAPVLSVGIANKGLARAKQNGVVVDERVLDRAFAQSKAAVAAPPAVGPATPGAPGTAVAAAPAATTTPTGKPGAADGRLSGPAAGRAMPPGVGGGFGGAGFGDAGVSLYRFGQGAGNSQDVINGLRIDGEKARAVLKDGTATKEAKEQAAKKLEAVDKAEKDNREVQRQLAENVRNERFVAGFGSNGGEEFLSFLNISEALLVKGGKDWEAWDEKMQKGLEKAQDKDGSWSGHHCITGKTFCTAGALLVLMADRTPFPAEVLEKANQPADPPAGKPAPPSVAPPAGK